MKFKIIVVLKLLSLFVIRLFKFKRYICGIVKEYEIKSECDDSLMTQRVDALSSLRPIIPQNDKWCRTQ